MNGIHIHLNEQEVNEMRQLAKDIAFQKMQLGYYQQDLAVLVNRYMRGLLGELAVEKWLGIPVVERVADQESHNHPDIQLIGWGVKSYRSDMPPLIEKKQTYPQIFVRCDNNMIKDKEADCYITGFATPKLMMDNLDDNQVQDWHVKKKGYKSAFTGIDKLFPITPQLKELILGGTK